MRPLSDADFKTLTATMTPELKASMQQLNEQKLKEREEKHAKLEAGKRKKGKPGEKTPVKPDADDPKTFDEMRDMLEGKPDPAAIEEDARKKKKDKKVDDDVPKYPEPDPPGPITFDPAKKEDLAKVIAGLKADAPATARDILDGIRRMVVSKVPIGEVLAELMPKIGEESQTPKIVKSLDDKLGEIQKGAGITDEEIRRRIEERKAELQRLRDEAAKGATQEQMEANRATREKAKEQEAEIAAKKEAADRKAGKIKKAAPKAKLPMNVDARRARLLGYVTADVADLIVKAKQKGEIRDSAVARMVRDYTDAYKFAAQQDLYDIRSKATDPKVARSAATGEAEEKVRKWRDDAIKDVEKFKTEQKTRDDANVVTLQGEVRTAGDAKSEAIRAWAEKVSGKKRTEEQKAADRATAVAERQAAEVKALAQLDHAKLARGVSGDFAVMDQIAEQVKQGHDRQTIIANMRLNAVQVAMLDAYLKPPIPGDDRALSGVMAGVRTRIKQQLQGDIAPEIEKEILGKHGGEVDNLNKIGGVQTKGFDAFTIAQKVHAALDQMDTDEEAVYDNLANLTKIQARAIELAYEKSYPGHTLDGDMVGGTVYGMSGKELERARALVRADQKTADAIGYEYALGKDTIWHDMGLKTADSEALDKINHGKTLEERQAAEDAYNARNDPQLKQQLASAKDDKEREEIQKRYRESKKSQLAEDADATLATERQKERFKFSREGDDDSADALELRDILPTPADVRAVEAQQERGGGGFVYVAADKKKIEKIYERIRREATERGDREGWTTDQIEAEIARRSARIENIFNSRFGKDYEGPEGKSALREAFDVGFRYADDEKKLANAYADNDTARIDAAKVHIEHRGVYADDDAQNAVLAAQYQRALAARRRDEMPIRRQLMARELAQLEKNTRDEARKKHLRDHPGDNAGAEKAAKEAWDGKKHWAARERLERDIDRSLEKAAAEQAKGNMNALRQAYKEDYGEDFDEVIKSDTSGYSGDKAELLLKQNGQLTLGQTMYYAVRGAGTDEEALEMLKGHTKAEIDVARAEFKQLALKDRGSLGSVLGAIHDGPGVDDTNMDREILDDVSGRTGFDVSQMLKGEPETIDDKRQRLLEAIDWEKKAGPLGRALAGDQETLMDEQLKSLDATIKKLEDPNLSPSQREMWLGFFDQGVESVNAGIKAHRETLDTWTDRITTAVGLVVGLAVTILTFGSAGLVLAAVLGSIYATAATIALKYVIQGEAYGWEEFGVDVIVGIIDAVTAALTAGMGEKLLGAAKNAAAPAVSRLAFGRAVQRSLGTGGRLAVINPAESALARSIPTSTALKEMVERGGLSKLLAITLAEGAETIVAATPSALASTLLDENTYKEGNILGNVFTNTVKQVGTGAAMGLGVKAGMKIGGAARSAHGFMADALKAPHEPALHSFELAKQKYPEMTYEEFSKARAAADLEIRMRQQVAAEHPPPEGAARDSARDTAFDASSGERAHDRLALPDERVPTAEGTGTERLSDAATPRGDDAVTIRTADLVEPRAMSEANVRELVPPSLRETLEIAVDPAQAPGTVKVERIMRLGIVVDVKLVVGPNVRPIDVMLHGDTVHAMKRYVGVSGTLIRALERARSIFARDGMPPFGSKAWESWHELKKLPAIVEQRLEMLRTGALDPRAEATIHADIQRISRQVDEHRATLARMDTSPGEGYIAVKGGPRKPPPDPVGDRPIKRELRGAAQHERFLAQHSAMENRFPGAEFLSVGPPWIEKKPTGDRIYRVLEVRDPRTGKVLALHEEILQRAPGEPDHWVKRGSESQLSGKGGEEAFQNRFEAEQAQGMRSNEILLPNDLIQNASGQGFDGVILRFDEHGATIVLVEVKHLGDRFVSFESITAINTTLVKNLQNLEAQLKDALGDKALAKSLGLTPEQARQAYDAAVKRKLEFELQLGHETYVGDAGDPRSSVLKDLRDDIIDKLGLKKNFPQANVRQSTMLETHVKLGERLADARERFEVDSGRELRALAKGHDTTLTEAGVRRAEAVLSVQKELPAVAARPIQVGTAPHTFIDKNGKTFHVFAPERGTAATKLAGDVGRALKAAQATGGKSAHVVVDVTNLTPAQRTTLRRELERLANKRPKLDLRQVLIVDMSRGTAQRFTGTK
jgi:hypothetical protein